MAAFAPPLIAAAWWKFGARAAAGLVFGCLIAYINFYWLKRVISGFVDRAAGTADQAIQRRNRLPLFVALFFDGRRRLCYIDCFTREPEWASCGLIFARSRHSLRSSVRTLRRLGARNVENCRLRNTESAMPEQLWFTKILNHLFAGPVTALLHALSITAKHPDAPIPNSFAMELLVFAFLLILFLLVRSRLSVESPGGTQHLFEIVEGLIQNQSNEIIGHHSEGYTPFLATLAFFILLCNLIGVIPGFESPTAVPIVPLGLRALRLRLLPIPGIQTRGNRLPEALCRPDAGLGSADDSHRTDQSPGARALI